MLAAAAAHSVAAAAISVVIYNICPISEASTVSVISRGSFAYWNPLANRWSANWKCFLVRKKESMAQ